MFILCLKCRETCSSDWLYIVNFPLNSVYNSAIAMCVMWTPLWLMLNLSTQMQFLHYKMLCIVPVDIFALGKSINFMWIFKNPIMKFYTHTKYGKRNATIFSTPVFSVAKMLKFKCSYKITHKRHSANLICLHSKFI